MKENLDSLSEREKQERELNEITTELKYAALE